MESMIESKMNNRSHIDKVIEFKRTLTVMNVRKNRFKWQ